MFWAHVSVRGRRRSLVLLGVLIGVTVGFAVSALVGARQTDSAVDRLRQQTHASDAVVFPSQVGLFRPDWAVLARRPEIAGIGVWDLLFGDVDDQPGVLLFGSDGGTYLSRVDKPVIVSGRPLDPAAADEVVVDENATNQVPLGSTFTFQPYGPTQTDATGQPTGPKVTMHVVGVARNLQEFLFTGQVLVSPGFIAKYGNQLLRLQNADVALRHGASDIGLLQRDANSLLGGAPVLDLHADSRRINTTLAVSALRSCSSRAPWRCGRNPRLPGARAIDFDHRRRRTRPAAFGMSHGDLGLATVLSHVIVGRGGRVGPRRGRRSLVAFPRGPSAGASIPASGPTSTGPCSGRGSPSRSSACSPRRSCSAGAPSDPMDPACTAARPSSLRSAGERPSAWGWAHRWPSSRASAARECRWCRPCSAPSSPWSG